MEEEADLMELIEAYYQGDFQNTVTNVAQSAPIYKCRILYDVKIHRIEWIPYRFKKIHSLQLVHADKLDYSHKFADRTELQSLLQKKGKAEDILIVKNGLITDTSYANVAFFDGLQWLTPLKPLLAGTKRAALLQQKKIQEADIRPQDLKQFGKLRLFNAMMDWEANMVCSDVLPKQILLQNT